MEQKKMQKQVLLLNATWEPLRVISWQKAVILLTLQKIEVIEEYDLEVHSVSLSFPLPAVVRLYRYIPNRVLFVRFSRQNIYARDRYTCQYCNRELGRVAELTYDHVIPRSRGGRTTWENIVTACVSCNRRKGGKTPEEAGMRLLRRPQRPEYLPRSIFQADWENAPRIWGPYLGLKESA